MKTSVSKASAKGVYRFKPGFNQPLKKNQPRISAGQYAKDFLFQENHPMISELSNCGVEDLNKTKYLAKHGGIPLRGNGILCLCLAFILNKQKDVHKIFIAFEVWNFWKDKYKLDRTSYNHALNRLAAIGVLSFKKAGNRNIQYYLSDAFIKNGGFDWFFNFNNIKPNGIFQYIPGCTAFLFSPFTEILNDLL